MSLAERIGENIWRLPVNGLNRPEPVQQPLPETEGSFCAQLAEYRHAIDYEHTSSLVRDTIMDKDTLYGKWWSETVVMDDGLRFKAHIGQPSKPKTDVPIVMTPPWQTRDDCGFNPYVANLFMQLGYPVILKGIPLNKKVPLSRDAYDTHKLLGNFDNLDIYDRRRLLLAGFSNGAMTGTGTAAYAPQFKREVLGGYLVDPCVVRRPQFSDILTGVHDLRQAPIEILSLIKQVRRHRLEQSMVIAKTVLPSFDFVRSNTLLAPALFSGEFGDLLDNIPSGYSIDYLLFTRSLGNQLKLFRERLKAGEHPYINTEERTGTHLSILNPATIESAVDYFRQRIGHYALAA